MSTKSSKDDNYLLDNDIVVSQKIITKPPGNF